ncbi:CLUMA_CG013105, isoform A [Clunio marinus]|uniref:Probable tRNA(His) guanylyltransferase n=1 Tax=Clunio marinus TaxID=568069 RepID=A0A1J1IHR8_9DIPT|nr:CLUMA_CG013105, isoform A [Clunio marinus]
MFRNLVTKAFAYNIRRASTNSSKELWDLHVGVLIERLPIISKKLTNFEADVMNTLRQIEFENSLKSDHEVKKEKDKLQQELIKAGTYEVDLDGDSRNLQTAQDMEDLSQQEVSKFQYASRETEDDKKGNLKSLNRNLDDTLMLVCAEKIDKNEILLLPQAKWIEGETLKETAERIVRDKFGCNLNVQFYGNAPCGFYKQKYKTENRKNSVGSKVFFYRAVYKSVIYCMSQKAERPVLQGQRIKTRKRDEKEKYDPTGFRDAVIAGLEKAEDLEQISKFLDTAGNKLDYRRYGEVLFDILIAGGLLVPGGSISQDGEKPYTKACIFAASEEMESMREQEQILIKLVRRYKYLEKMFEEEMKKVLVFIKGFQPIERVKLARMTALWVASGAVPPIVLAVLNNEHLIKDGVALEFLLELFVTLKQERGIPALITALKKGSLESRLMEFLPLNKRSEENFIKIFTDRGLEDIVKLHKAQASQEAKRELQSAIIDDIKDGKSHKDIINDIKELSEKNIIPEHEVITIVWTTIMSLGEWNKKEELVADQALRHLKIHAQFFQAFTTNTRSELALILKIQEYCYENMNFMNSFYKIMVLFYKLEIISEDSVLKWYRDAHSPKGKMHFLEKMRPFMEWLEKAEEGKLFKFICQMFHCFWYDDQRNPKTFEETLKHSFTFIMLSNFRLVNKRVSCFYETFKKQLHKSVMANSRYEYVKDFEKDDRILPNCWIVVRLDGKSFHKFTDAHNFEKPNDMRGISLMNFAASCVMKEFNEIILSYGQSDEYSFVFHRSAAVYNRRESKIVSNVNSLFTSSFVFYWDRWFGSEKLKYPPSFDARVVLYPTDENLKDYLSWRQADVHINNLYNTCFWNLVLRKGMKNSEAEETLRGTVSGDKNEILFSEFGINYNNVPAIFRKGTILLTKQIKIDKSRTKKTIVPIFDDLIKPKFWNEHDELLERKNPKFYKFPDDELPKLVEEFLKI